MSGQIKDDQETNDSYSLPETVDEFLNYMDVNWGRTRALTKPNLSNEAADDTVSEYSADDDEDNNSDAEIVKKARVFDVEELARGLKGTGLEESLSVSEHHVVLESLNFEDVKAKDLDKNQLKKLQNLSSMVGSLAAQLFKACTQAKKNLEPLRTELDKVLELAGKLTKDSDKQHVKALNLRLAPILKNGFTAVQDLLPLKEMRDRLAVLLKQIPIEYQGDSNIVGKAPTDAAEARRAFKMLEMYSFSIFDDAKTTINAGSAGANVPDEDEEREAIRSKAVPVVVDSKKLRAILLRHATEVRTLSLALPPLKGNQNLQLQQRIDLATQQFAVLLKISGMLTGYYEEQMTVLRKNGEEISQWDDDGVVQLALKELKSALEVYNVLVTLTNAAVEEHDEAIKELKELQKQPKDVQKANEIDVESIVNSDDDETNSVAESLTGDDDKDTVYVTEFAKNVREKAVQLKKIMDQLILELKSKNSQLIVHGPESDVPVLQQLSDALVSKDRVDEIVQMFARGFLPQAESIKKRNGEITDWRGELKIVDDTLDDVDAMVDGVGDLEDALENSMTQHEQAINRLTRLARKQAANQKKNKTVIKQIDVESLVSKSNDDETASVADSLSGKKDEDDNRVSEFAKAVQDDAKQLKQVMDQLISELQSRNLKLVVQGPQSNVPLDQQLSDAVNSQKRVENLANAFAGGVKLHAVKIKERNGEIKAWRGKLTIVDDTLDDVDAMVEGTFQLEDALESSMTQHEQAITRLTRLIKEQQDKKNNKADVGDVALKGDQVQLLTSQALAKPDDQWLKDLQRFQEISQQARLLEDECEDDLLHVEKLNPATVDEANEATAKIRERLTKAFLPELRKMNDFLKTFPREHFLYNKHLQQAGMDASNLQDVCEELQEALVDLYSGLGTQVAEIDPDIPPPPKLTKEEGEAKSFRRAAEQFERESRQLHNVLANGAREIRDAASPKEFDRLVSEHIAGVKEFDIPVQKARIALRQRINQINQLEGSKQFQVDRAAGLQAFQRAEDLDLNRRFAEYSSARDDALAALKAGIKKCQPLIAEATKLKDDILLLIVNADQGMRATSWLPHGLNNDFSDYKSRAESLQLDVEEIELEAGVQVTSKCRDAVDAATETLMEARVYLGQLLKKKFAPKSLVAGFEKLSDDCDKLNEMLNSDEHDYESNGPQALWKTISKQFHLLDAVVRNLKFSTQDIQMTRGMVRDLTLIMSGKEPPNAQNRNDLEEKSKDRIAELTKQAQELQKKLSQLSEAAVVFQEDVQTILFSEIYKTVEDRRGAWDRLVKSVLNPTTLLDADDQITTIYVQLDEFEQTMHWQPKNVKQLRAAYSQVLDALEDAQAEVDEARTQAKMLPGQLQQRLALQKALDPFINPVSKSRIRDDQSDLSDDQFEPNKMLEQGYSDLESLKTIDDDNSVDSDNISNDSSDDTDSNVDSNDDQQSQAGGPSYEDALNAIDQAVSTMSETLLCLIMETTQLKLDDPSAVSALNLFRIQAAKAELDLRKYTSFLSIHGSRCDESEVTRLTQQCQTAQQHLQQLGITLDNAEKNLLSDDNELDSAEVQSKVTDVSTSNSDDHQSNAGADKIPQAVLDEINQCYQTRFSRLKPMPDNPDEIKKEILEAVIAKTKGNLSGGWREVCDNETYRLYSAERDRRDKAAEAEQKKSSFELTAAFWKSKKQGGVDTLGKLSRSLQKYEDLLKKANSAAGVDKLELLVKVKKQLIDVQQTAARALKGTSDDKHGATQDLLRDVPSAVSAANQDANSKLDKLNSYFRNLTYKQVRDDKKLRKLWEAYYSDPHQGTVKEQEDFIKEYEKGRLNQKTYDRFLKKGAPNFLNLSIPKINQFAINDKDGWEKVYRQCIRQQELHLTDGMFGLWMIEERKR